MLLCISISWELELSEDKAKNESPYHEKKMIDLLCETANHRH